MRLVDYLRDQIRLIVFFIILLGFILSVVTLGTLGNANQMQSYDVMYLLIVSLLLIFVYLITDFIRNRSHERQLQTLKRAQGIEWVTNLPTAKSTLQTAYQELFLKLYREHHEGISQFQAKSKEDLEFVTTWVHEIKTPISVANLLIQNSQGSASEETLESIEEELEKIEEYVTRALYYSRSHDFAKDYLIKDITLEGLIKESVKRHSKVFIRKKIRIQLQETAGQVATDKKWLGFVLDQILDNALKYTPAYGVIAISTESNDQELILKVMDSGIGIRSEDQTRIFERGFTGYNGRNELCSTGMGMYLSQRVARKLGHYLSVSSNLNAGTTISIHFPKWSNYFDVTKM